MRLTSHCRSLTLSLRNLREPFRIVVTRSLSILALTLPDFAFRMKNEAVWRNFSNAKQSGLLKANFGKTNISANWKDKHPSYQRIQRNPYKKFFQMNTSLTDPLERFISNKCSPHIEKPQCSVMSRCDMASQAIKADICTTLRIVSATKPKRLKTTRRWGDCPSDPRGKLESLVAGFYMSVYDTKRSEISTR